LLPLEGHLKQEVDRFNLNNLQNEAEGVDFGEIGV
jgi:hypothetical protein